jgi:hypothetical protein
MFKHHLTVSDYAIIAANLVPLYGVLFLNWEVNILFLVYCLETVIIGIFNVLKMAIVTHYIRGTEDNIYLSKNKPVGGWYLILFFIFHYGLFVFIQTQIFFHSNNFLNDDHFITGYSNVIMSLGKDGRLVLWIFVLSYTIQTFYSFGLTGQYKTIRLNRLMYQPYTRIFIQQFVVVTGSIFLTMGGGKVFMIIFVPIKMIFEIYINFDKYLQIAAGNKIKSSY